MHYTELPSKEDMTSLHGETWTWVEGVVAPLDGALAGPVSEVACVAYDVWGYRVLSGQPLDARRTSFVLERGVERFVVRLDELALERDKLASTRFWTTGRARSTAALAFLDWFQQPETQIAYAELGGSPVSAAAYEGDFAEKPENRYMPVMRDALPTARRMWTIPEGAEIVAVTEVGLNRAVAGEIGAVEALNSMAAEIEKIMQDAGYETGRLPDLTE